jgi:cyanide hydratase
VKSDINMSTPRDPLKYKAAVVQAEPGWFDLDLSTQKTIDLINEAGSKGCKLIAFPELCTTPFQPSLPSLHPLPHILSFSLT